MTTRRIWITAGYVSGSRVKGEFDSEGPQHNTSRLVVPVNADDLDRLLPFLETADDASEPQLRHLCRILYGDPDQPAPRGLTVPVVKAAAPRRLDDPRHVPAEKSGSLQRLLAQKGRK